MYYSTYMYFRGWDSVCCTVCTLIQRWSCSFGDIIAIYSYSLICTYMVMSSCIYYGHYCKLQNLARWKMRSSNEGGRQNLISRGGRKRSERDKDL